VNSVRHDKHPVGGVLGYPRINADDREESRRRRHGEKRQRERDRSPLGLFEYVTTDESPYPEYFDSRHAPEVPIRTFLHMSAARYFSAGTKRGAVRHGYCYRPSDDGGACAQPPGTSMDFVRLCAIRAWCAQLNYLPLRVPAVQPYYY